MAATPTNTRSPPTAVLKPHRRAFSHVVEERFDSAAIEQKAGACEDAGIRLKLSLTEVCFDDVKLVKN